MSSGFAERKRGVNVKLACQNFHVVNPVFLLEI